ncbi:hypothetical protein GVM20_07825 [Porphyrobacter sp. SLTP]|uniref:hypothetical protein n=1 Tax=Porphyrobacter sp. SLTP TaxID=2683266 RepID=UPI00141225C4|nr:hypothetical protein [Porphyrobacter sp. SLTP]NBB25029.1 hypothetical protein [Porphyrobacter sp. SLTP]
MIGKSPTNAAVQSMRRMTILAAAAMVCVIPNASAQENDGAIPPGDWQGNYALTRIDPRIRTLAGADLIGMQVIHDRGEATATVSWDARRAICPDPLEAPCEWIGANGTDRARVIGDTLVLALRLSPEEADPAILVMQRRPTGTRKPARLTGFITNARADWDIGFDALKQD